MAWSRPGWGKHFGNEPGIRRLVPVLLPLRQADTLGQGGQGRGGEVQGACRLEELQCRLGVLAPVQGWRMLARQLEAGSRGAVLCYCKLTSLAATPCWAHQLSEPMRPMRIMKKNYGLQNSCTKINFVFYLNSFLPLPQGERQRNGFLLLVHSTIPLSCFNSLPECPLSLGLG